MTKVLLKCGTDFLLKMGPLGTILDHFLDQKHNLNLSHVKGNNSDSGDKKEKEKRDCSLSAKWYSIVQENSPFSEAFLDHSKYNTIIY